ncbi:MAG: type II toxin-antitoxin system RelE/ParE family toxin [Bacteroidales bacterium]|nr:type II toxin-antitoxin system RelE/ParE family toxin [Bacteroidales bacterium]
MKTIWDPAAKESLRQIARYINTQFGRETRRNFITKVHETETLLKRHPNIGFPDPLFSHRRYVYRSVIINGLSKLVYYVDNDSIYIAALWDTRREPNHQADSVE